jgi:NADPH:quinone reductase-like Zn-dependent oxidoreductase
VKAVTRTKYGPPEVLRIEEVDKPVPKDNEILVKVYATTVNRTDCAILRAQPFIMRFFTGLFRPGKKGMGTDFAGRIEAIGTKVSEFKVGDRVFGFNDGHVGTQAQYVVLKANSPIITIPDTISYAQAAASPEGAHYAINSINKTKLKQGDFVLVNGATGAIGSATVQLLKYYGAHVTAVCNTKNIELVKSLGADRTIDYTTQDFTKEDQTYHYIFDMVGKSSFGKCKPLLKPGGVFMSSDLGPGNENIYLPLTTRFSNKRVVFPMPVNIRGSLKMIKELLETKQFTPVIDRTYPFEKIVDAYTYVASGQKTGNVIARFNEDE